VQYTAACTTSQLALQYNMQYRTACTTAHCALQYSIHCSTAYTVQYSTVQQAVQCSVQHAQQQAAAWYLFRGARKHDHGPAVDPSVRQACNAVHCTWARYCQQHPGHPRQVPTSRCCIPCCLLISEADEPDANCLQTTARYLQLYRLL